MEPVRNFRREDIAAFRVEQPHAVNQSAVSSVKRKSPSEGVSYAGLKISRGNAYEASDDEWPKVGNCNRPSVCCAVWHGTGHAIENRCGEALRFDSQPNDARGKDRDRWWYQRLLHASNSSTWDSFPPNVGRPDGRSRLRADDCVSGRHRAGGFLGCRPRGAFRLCNG